MLDELAAELMRRQRETRHRERTERLWRPSLTPVTDLGYFCDRRIVYHRVWPELAAQIGFELASIFTEGKLHEKDIRRELMELGFEVVQAETNFRDERLEITGTIDGKLTVPDKSARKGFRLVPVEIKSIAGSPPATTEAWRHTSRAILRRYFAQLQTYLFLTNELGGLGLFKEKATGLWTVVPAELDYGYTEELLQRAERVRDAVRAIKGTGDNPDPDQVELPDRLADRSECPGCPWVSTCNPADAPIDPILLATDPELLAELEEHEQLERNAARWKELDGSIKDRFKLTKGDKFIVGGADGFLVTKRKHGKGVRVKMVRARDANREI